MYRILGLHRKLTQHGKMILFNSMLIIDICNSSRFGHGNHDFGLVVDGRCQTLCSETKAHQLIICPNAIRHRQFPMPKPVGICNYDHRLIPCDKTGGRCYEDMELLGTKWSRHVKLGGSCSTKHAGVLLGVDAIFLSEALDTVRSILLPCWAHYFSNVSLSRDKTNLSKIARRQTPSAPSPNLPRHQKFSHGNSPGQMSRFSSSSLYIKPAL